jgi:hypothetical protein
LHALASNFTVRGHKLGLYYAREDFVVFEFSANDALEVASLY